MLHLFFKALRHKKEHTRRLPTGKVVSIRAFDYNDPRIARLRPGRGKDTATEDLFNPEFSGDLYDPKAVRAVRQAAPKTVKTPRLVSAQQGPDIVVPDLFSALDNAEKISYPDPEASQSGEAKTSPKGEEKTMDIADLNSLTNAEAIDHSTADRAWEKLRAMIRAISGSPASAVLIWGDGIPKIDGKIPTGSGSIEGVIPMGEAIKHVLAAQSRKEEQDVFAYWDKVSAISTEKETISIAGNTFANKDVLKSGGWKWNANTKTWEKHVSKSVINLAKDAPHPRVFGKYVKGNRAGCIIRAEDGTVLWQSKTYQEPSGRHQSLGAEARENRLWHGTNDWDKLINDPDFL